VREALRHRPQHILRLLVSAAPGRRRAELEELCRRHGIELLTVPEPLLRGRAGPAHNGVVAELRDSYAATEAASDRHDTQLVVLFEDVQDPRNLGAALRVCEAVGVGRVMLRDRGSAPLSPTVAKTSAGATEWLAVERIGNSALELERLKDAGFWVYGTDAHGEAPWQVDLQGPVVVCFGGEERGLRPRTRTLCDRFLGLPMRGNVDSLNLSTAVAAILYEALRQRLTAEPDAPSTS
jgi:23S rRNA (guanosine2251-2'-O)-methyltransferase